MSPGVMNTYNVEQWLSPGPGRGHWYICRQVKANRWAEAVVTAFPANGGKVPHGYRVVLV